MDEFERRVRAARPLSGHRDLPLSDRAKRELADLVLTGSPHRQRRGKRRTRRRPVMLAALVVAAMGTIGVGAMVFPRSTYAATPAMLDVTPIHKTVAEVLDPIAARLEAEPSRVRPRSVTINVRAWTLSTDQDGQSLSSSIVPQNYEITMNADGSRHQRSTSAGPVTRYGSPEPSDAGPPVGTLLQQESWGPGEYISPYSTAAPANPAEYEKYFNTAIQSDSSLPAAVVLQEVNGLLLEQKLGPHQEGALLRYLTSLPDITLEGKVTDRLGRSGAAFSAVNPDRPEYKSLIIISTTDGSVLSSEKIYRGHDRTDIPSPSVVTYYAWKE